VNLRERLQDFRYWHEAVLGGVLVLIVIWAGVTEPSFLGPGAQKDLATHAWGLAILAVPMTLIIITAGIDLSVGSTMALSAVVLGLAYGSGVPVAVAALLAVLTGVAAGALNGVFVAYVKVHPLLVTLASLSAYRGIAEGISLGASVSRFPAWFAVLGQGSVLGLPVAGLVFAAFAVAAGIVLARAPLGRYLRAIGHNEKAAHFSGVPVDRIKLLLYTLSGAAAGFAAVVLVSRRNTAKADMASGMELDVITAVVLGGTSIFGGRGRIVGTLLGVLVIHEVREFVSWHWGRDELNFIVVGTLLVASVLLNRLLSPKARED
jgi:rhamnose transport system permease protein